MTELLLQAGFSLVVAGASLLVGVLIWKPQRRWEMRRDACSKALDVVDAVASHYPWTRNSPEQSPYKQRVAISEVRHAFAQLTATCRHPETIDSFVSALALGIVGKSEHPPGVSGRDIHHFRLQVRRELGLKRRALDEVKHHPAVIARTAGTDHEV